MLYAEYYGRLSEKGKANDKTKNLFENFTAKEVFEYDFEMPFDKAEKFFAGMEIVKASDFYIDLEKRAGQSFTISHISAVETLNGVKKYLGEQLGSGKVNRRKLAEKINEFATENGDSKLKPFHVETIIRTNLQTAFSKGRFKEQIEGADPYFQYFSTVDGRETDLCLALDGKVFDKSDPIMTNYYPPNHFNCRSTIVALDKETVKNENLTVEPSVTEYLKRFADRHGIKKGLTPGAGFGNAPDKSLDKWIVKKCRIHKLRNVRKTVPVFQTKSEAVRYYENKLGIPFKVSSLEPETIKAVGDHLIKLKKRFGHLGFWVEVKAELRTIDGDFACNWRGLNHHKKSCSNILDLNRAELNSPLFKEKIKRAYQSRSLTSQNLQDVLNHEFGHCLTFQDYDLTVKFLTEEKRKPIDFSFVSLYPIVKDDLAEYIAEAFALYVKGEKLQKKTFDLLKQYLKLK